MKKKLDLKPNSGYRKQGYTFAKAGKPQKGAPANPRTSIKKA